MGEPRFQSNSTIVEAGEQRLFRIPIGARAERTETRPLRSYLSVAAPLRRLRRPRRLDTHIKGIRLERCFYILYSHATIRHSCGRQPLLNAVILYYNSIIVHLSVHFSPPPGGTYALLSHHENEKIYLLSVSPAPVFQRVVHRHLHTCCLYCCISLLPLHLLSWSARPAVARTCNHNMNTCTSIYFQYYSGVVRTMHRGRLLARERSVPMNVTVVLGAKQFCLVLQLYHTPYVPNEGGWGE